VHKATTIYVQCVHNYGNKCFSLFVPFLPVSFSPEILSSVIPYYVFQPVDSSDSMRSCGMLKVMPCSGTGDPLQLCVWVLPHLCSNMHHGVETGPHHHCTSTSHNIKIVLSLLMSHTSTKILSICLQISILLLKQQFSSLPCHACVHEQKKTIFVPILNNTSIWM